MDCLTPAALNAMVAGTLPEAELSSARAHVESCAACREHVQQRVAQRMSVEGNRTQDTVGQPGVERIARAVARENDRLIRGDAVGRYMVLGQLGEGGMGVVYAAHDPELDRKVAIKLLQANTQTVEGGGTSGQARLLREAQALARLSHPNVVSVYDVGTLGERVFVAMEHVDGETLRKWQDSEHPWKEILQIYIGAGRGLAAAHAAGLVHRDFKPDNVLLGTDGRPRVMDFGLARVEGVDPLLRSAPPSAITPSSVIDAGDDQRSNPTGSLSGSSSRGLHSPLTRAGSVMGTPAYMPPEQVRGEGVDARSDQFSFCVSLYEALYGKRPFKKTSTPNDPGRWTVRDTPSQTNVPPWLRKIILRGLSLIPAERYASIEDLLSALLDDPSVKRRRALLAAGFATLSLGAAVGVWQTIDRQAQTCRGAERKLDGRWDPAMRAAIQGAFKQSGKLFADAAFSRVDAVLNRYATDWTAMRTDACEATRLREEQSETVMQLRMSCLDDRLEELRALTQLLSKADAQVVEKANNAVLALSPLAQCADVTALTRTVPPPGDPQVAERVAEVRAQLSELKTLTAAGKYAEAIPVSEAVSKLASEVAYAPIEAEVQYSVGKLNQRRALWSAAEQAFQLAAWRAEAGRLDALRASANIALIDAYGQQARTEEVKKAVQQAEASVQRIDSPPAVTQELESYLGNVARRSGKPSEAVPHYRKAVASLEQSGALEDVKSCPTLDGLAGALDELSQSAEALTFFERCYQMRLAALGPDHPDLIYSHLGVGTALYNLGRYQDARTHYARAVVLSETTPALRNTFYAMALHNLGTVQQHLGEHADSVPTLRRAVEVQEQALGTDHPNTTYFMTSLANALGSAGKYAEAFAVGHRALELTEKSGAEGREIPYQHEVLAALYAQAGEDAKATQHYEKALSALKKNVGEEHGWVAQLQVALSGTLRRQFELGRARRSAESGLKSLLEVRGPAHPDTATAYLAIAEVELAQQRIGPAKAAFEKALEIGEKQPAEGNALTPDALRGLAEVLISERRPGEAIPLLERALRGKDLKTRHPRLEAALSETLAKARKLAAEETTQGAVHGGTKDAVARSTRP